LAIKSEKTVLNFFEALEKLRQYCAYSERSKQQVERKMKLILAKPEEFEELILALERENFLNIERYTIGYARGKSRIKGWGVNKIVQNLKFELGQEFREELVLEGIDNEKAFEKLEKELRKKLHILSSKKDPNVSHKLLRFCLMRGFEMDKSLQMIKEIRTKEGL
jgi:regulatory protein